MSTERTLRVYDYVNQPFERVRAALLADANGIFVRATNTASERAQNLISALRVKIAGFELGKEIQIEVLGSFDTERPGFELTRETRIELQWTASGNPGLFPTMKAELALYPLSRRETQLELSGTYHPPLGVLGAALDAVVGNRVAQASVHKFIADLAEQLRRELAAARGPGANDLRATPAPAQTLRERGPA